MIENIDYFGLILLLIVTIVIFSLFRNEKRIKDKLGLKNDSIHLGGLSKNKSNKYFLAIFILALSVEFIYEFSFHYDDNMLWRIIIRMAFFSLWYFYMERSSLIWFGENGFALSSNKFYTWHRVEIVKWDNDINQGLWGISFFMKANPVPIRLYIPRKIKVQTEQTINKYYNENKASVN